MNSMLYLNGLRKNNLNNKPIYMGLEAKAKVKRFKIDRHRDSFIDGILDWRYFRYKNPEHIIMGDYSEYVDYNKLYSFLINKMTFTNAWHSYYSNAYYFDSIDFSYVNKNFYSNYLDFETFDQVIGQNSEAYIVPNIYGAVLEMNGPYMIGLFSHSRIFSQHIREKRSVLYLLDENVCRKTYIFYIHGRVSWMQLRIMQSEYNDLFDHVQIIAEGDNILHRISGLFIYNIYSKDFRLYLRNMIVVTGTSQIYLSDGQRAEKPHFVIVESAIYKNTNNDYIHRIKYMNGTSVDFELYHIKDIMRTEIMTRNLEKNYEQDILETMEIIRNNYVLDLFKKENKQYAKSIADKDDEELLKIINQENSYKKMRLFMPTQAYKCTKT